MNTSFNQEDIFHNIVMSDEKVLWSAQPEISINFNRVDILLIPFSLFWTIATVFIFISAYKHINSSTYTLTLFAIIFFVSGFYLIVGRFIFKRIKKRHIYYAVTNKRILIVSTLMKKKYKS